MSKIRSANELMAESAVASINFKDAALELLPEGANFEACLTCGLCSSGCPASGIENMDPRKFIRMAMLGMDEELSSTPWIWCCTLCKRCQYVCPMNIDVSQLVFLARGNWPEDKKPSGIVRSCQLTCATDSTSAMGMAPADFVSVVGGVLEEVRTTQGYLSGSGPGLLFGLGYAQEAARVRVKFPSGEVRVLEKVPAGRVVVSE